MALSHKDRFKLKSDLTEILYTREWSSTHRLTLLFDEFDVQVPYDDWTIESVLSTVSDQTLVEMYALVFDVPETEVADVVESEEPGNWNSGYVRLFISHSAKHKAFISQVADELLVVGIHGFVAHETMQVTKPWQEQIEAALRSMDAFVAFVHPEFQESAWCHQETGWALGRRVPHFAVRLGADPVGFLGRDQWPSTLDQRAKDVANVIQRWIAGLPSLGPSVVNGLLKALEDANDYVSAGAAAKRIAQLDSLSASDFARLTKIYWANDQVRGGALPTKELQPFYQRNGMTWPPPKSSLASNLGASAKVGGPRAAAEAGPEPPF